MLITGLLAAAALTATVSAQDRITFTSNGTQIVGYHWSPKCDDYRSRLWGQRKAPVVVMAHGFSALQTSKLQPYAERFSSEGYHAITFDYRTWGQSDGQPRNIVDLPAQQDDYRAAVKFVKTLRGVDPDHIIIWGTSLGGGTVLKLGADFYNDTSSGVKGVIAQCPHTNGLETSSQTPQGPLPDLVQLSIQDTEIAKNGSGTPIYVPCANNTGEIGLLTQAGALAGYQSIQPDPPGPEGENFAARFIITLPLFSPDATAYQSHLATYMGIGLQDNIVGYKKAVELAGKMPNVTAYQYDAGHFDFYPGASIYQENIDNQVKFLKDNFPLHRW